MRIVSLAPNISEIVYLLNSNELVGITNFCDYPENIKSLPRIGNWTNNIDVEKIKALNPDIVIGCMYVDERVKQELENKGIEVKVYDAHIINDIYNIIKSIGKIIDEEERAKQIIGKMKESIKKIRKHMKNYPRIRVYAEEYPLPPFASGNWIPELIEVCNAEAMIKPGERSRETSFDEVRNFDPHVVVLHWCGYGKSNRMKEIFLRRDNHAWSKLKASNSIYVVDDSILNRPSPRIIEGLMELKRIIEGYHESKNR